MSLFKGGISNTLNSYNQQGATSLDKLTDVLVTAPINDQVLTYDSSNGLWCNKDNSGGTGYITADSDDTLTNKTLDSETNTVVANYLHGYNNKILIDFTEPPVLNQVLTMISTVSNPNVVGWSAVDHTNLDNKGTNTHEQIDTHISVNTAHGTNSAIVGINDTQSLTNKTLNDTTNTITADKLHVSGGGTVTVNTSSAPTTNQALIATGNTSASWQSIDHTKMSDVVYNNIQNSDILRYNHSSSKYENSSALTTAETNINELKKKTQVVNTSTVLAGGVIITDYTGASPNEIVYRDNSTPYYYSGITGFAFSTLHSGQGLQVTSDYIERQTSTATGWSLSTNSFARWNIALDQSIRMSKISFTGMDCTYNTAQPGTLLIQCYGSNSLTDFSDITTSNITLPLLGSGTNQVTFNINFTSNDTFKYLCMKLSTTTINGWFKFINNSKAQIERSDGTYQALVKDVDYTITTDTSTGKPKLTFTNAGTIYYNTNRLLLYEAYSRLYKQTAKGLQTATTIVDISGATAPTTGQVLVATGGTGASWQTLSTGSTSLAGLTTDVDVTTVTPANGNLLIYNGTTNKWVNSTSLKDSLLFVSDDVDSNKKMQFQLSAITTSYTRTMTIPDFNCTLAGASNAQAAGTLGYALISSGATGTAPTWAKYDHVNLLNNGSYTHSDIDVALNYLLDNRLSRNLDISFYNPSSNDLLTYGLPTVSNQVILTTVGLYMTSDIYNKQYSLVYNGAPYTPSSPLHWFIQLVYANGVIYGFTDTYAVYTSTNYKKWTLLTTNLNTILTTVRNTNADNSSSFVIHDGNYFYAAGNKTEPPIAGQYVLARSVDAITWTAVGPTVNTSTCWRCQGINYIPSSSSYKYHILTGNNADNKCIVWYSNDGTNFTSREFGQYYYYGTTAVNDAVQVRYLNGIYFIASGYYYNNQNGIIYNSNYLATTGWTNIQVTPGYYKSFRIEYSPQLNLYVVLDGALGRIYSSTDLTTWTLRFTGSATTFNNIYWCSGKYFFVTTYAGVNGTIYTSTDGINWSTFGTDFTKVINIFSDTVSTFWYNKPIITALSSSTPSIGQVLTATSSTTANWQTPTGGAMSLDNLTDVQLTLPVTTTQTLRYDGTNWVNISSNFSSLPDVDVSTKQDNDILIYNSGKFITSHVLPSNLLSNVTLSETSTQLTQNQTFTTSYSNANNIFVTGLTQSTSSYLSPNNFDMIGNTNTPKPLFQNTTVTNGPTYTAIKNTNILMNAPSAQWGVISYFYNSPTTLTGFECYSGSINPNILNAQTCLFNAFKIYGSMHTNSESNSVKNDYTTGTLLFSESDLNSNYTNSTIYSPEINKNFDGPNPPYVRFLLNASSAYTAYHIVINGIRDQNNTKTEFNSLGWYCMISFLPMTGSSTNSNMILGTDFQISTDSITGAPRLQKLTSDTTLYTINLNSMATEECYRRVFPVVRDTKTVSFAGTNHQWNITNKYSAPNDLLTFQCNSVDKMYVDYTGKLYLNAIDLNTIFLKDGVNTTILTQSSIPATQLRGVVISSATPTSGKVLTTTSSTTAEWSSVSAYRTGFEVIEFVQPSQFYDYSIPDAYKYYTCTDLLTTIYSFDITNILLSVSSHPEIQLPAFGNNDNGKVIYVQINGHYENTFFYGVTFKGRSDGVVGIFSAPGVGSAWYSDLLGFVYKFTFYTVGNNDWNYGIPAFTNQHSWKVEPLGSLQAELYCIVKETTDTIFVKSINYSMSVNVGLPYSAYRNGKEYIIKDMNGFMNNSNVILILRNLNYSFEGNYFNAVLTTSKRYVYFGDDNSGNFWLI